MNFLHNSMDNLAVCHALVQPSAQVVHTQNSPSSSAALLERANVLK